MLSVQWTVTRSIRLIFIVVQWHWSCLSRSVKSCEKIYVRSVLSHFWSAKYFVMDICRRDTDVSHLYQIKLKCYYMKSAPSPQILFIIFNMHSFVRFKCINNYLSIEMFTKINAKIPTHDEKCIPFVWLLLMICRMN